MATTRRPNLVTLDLLDTKAEAHPAAPTGRQIATRFCQHFYQALLRGQDVIHAFSAAESLLEPSSSTVLNVHLHVASGDAPLDKSAHVSPFIAVTAGAVDGGSGSGSGAPQGSRGPVPTVTGPRDTPFPLDNQCGVAGPIQSCLFGRAVELRQCVRELQQHRVVLLHGPGGVGKTAIASAALLSLAMRSVFRDGCAWLSLSSIRQAGGSGGSSGGGGGGGDGTPAIAAEDAAAAGALLGTGRGSGRGGSPYLTAYDAMALERAVSPMGKALSPMGIPGKLPSPPNGNGAATASPLLTALAVRTSATPPLSLSRGHVPSSTSNRANSWIQRNRTPRAVGAACYEIATLLGLACHGCCSLADLCHSLHNRRVLIVLEDCADDLDLARELIRGLLRLTAGVTLLLTSRVDLDDECFDHGVKMEVRPLAKGDAVALFQYHCPSSREVSVGCVSGGSSLIRV